MSKISFDMRSKMGDMSEIDFENMMGLSKAAFLDYLDKAAAGEARCAARPGDLAPDFSAHSLSADGSISSDLFTLSTSFACSSIVIFL